VNENLKILLQGLLLGFSIAAPVGPIGVLCIRRALAVGRVTGFLSGLGAATADMFYGSIAAFGLTAISSLLIEQRFWFGLLGGLFLTYLGIRTFLAKPAENAAQANSTSLLGAYLSTFFLTLSNPMTILSFTAMFAALQFHVDGFLAAAILVTGVFLGSAAWWLTLSLLVGAFRERFTPDWMQWVNRISGVVILGFGIVILLSLS